MSPFPCSQQIAVDRPCGRGCYLRAAAPRYAQKGASVLRPWVLLLGVRLPPVADLAHACPLQILRMACAASGYVQTAMVDFTGNISTETCVKGEACGQSLGGCAGGTRLGRLVPPRLLPLPIPCAAAIDNSHTALASHRRRRPAGRAGERAGAAGALVGLAGQGGALVSRARRCPGEAALYAARRRTLDIIS